MRTIACLTLLFITMPCVAQANDQAAVLASQQANATAMQAAQQAGPLYSSGSAFLSRPKISVKSGTYKAPLTVTLDESERGETIYYTTDGWTPTLMSRQYDGPIPITHSTYLQAIAVVQYGGISSIAEAIYVLPSAPAQVTPPTVVMPNGLLRQGTPIHLAFATGVDSTKANIGDKIPLRLTSKIQLGNQTVDPAQASAQATVIHVDRKSLSGYPGVLTIRLDTLTINNVLVPLVGIETRVGKDPVGPVVSTAKLPRTRFSDPPHVGETAEIDPGTPITAHVVADTQIAPASPMVASGSPPSS
jgi:hypothetical protein